MPETIPNPVAVSRNIKVNKKLLFKGMDMPKAFKEKSHNKMRLATADSPMVTIGTADSSRRMTGVELKRVVSFVNFTQPPYTDGDLSRMEAATRRNLAVRTAITVREHFAFGHSSKIVIELNESDKLDKDEEQQRKMVENLTNENIKILKIITDLDEKVELVKHATGPFYWQNLMFGRGVMIKIYDDTEYTKIKKLMPVNSRRLGLNIMDEGNAMEFEGVYIDGDAVDRLSLIYGAYQDKQISPYTENYGYSALEPIMYVAQAHNIATEEDIPEILKSAWLKAILFIVNTAGLDSTDATTQITTIIDQINPGKYVGVNTDVKEAIPLDLDPNFEGIMKMVDSLESKIFKSLHVPQFLVQSEDMANMATANKSASLFIDGIVASDQMWMSDILWKQWYEPLLRRELNLELDLDNPEEEYTKLPFKIKRIWDRPSIEEFIELSAALVALKNAGIWDVTQANKMLNTPEVAKRVQEELDKQEDSMPEFDPNNPNQVRSNIKNNNPGNSKSPVPAAKPNVKTGGATVQQIRDEKLNLLKELQKKVKQNTK